MVFATALFCQALLVTVALAAPRGVADRLTRHRGGPMWVSNGPDNNVSNVTQALYTTNWAGAVYNSYPSNTFTSVTGTFVVPTPQAPSDGFGPYSAAVWVGIDGSTCSSAILQTGISFTVDGGSVTYDAWHEWYPEISHDFSSMTMSAGDTIKLTVTATSSTTGTAVIENLTTGNTVSESLTSSYPLCMENAEWIVEDYGEGYSMVPFANFGTVTFTDASATMASGSIGPSDATIYNIQQRDNVLTSVKESSSGVTIQYV